VVGVAYDWVILSSSNLWGTCTSFAELEIHLNGSVPDIGQVTVWISQIEYFALK
jgi:hypothetical protein